jgi:4-amino-4-deoxy-L-arabinose transferase-like glycosyltransferase
VRERLTRPLWPILIVAAFCLPLFVGLGDLDLRGDEAGHSFSVDRILETGDWLVPKASPHPNAPFLEKPPLKFWLVAAGIRAGLPHDEFGLRFWDPVFGGLAFLYVFAIGRRLDGPVCGAVAVLVLFVTRNLLFEHGLRDNNMEAPLLLSYCGGMFHYLTSTSAGSPRARRLHAVAVGAYFALGFMVKFVAALFLPIVLGLVSMLAGRYRGQVFRDWRSWLIAALVALALIAPWFVYATVRFGRGFWDMILGIQVYTRLTSHLDPQHLNPWNHYLVEMSLEFREAGAFWLIVAGGVLFSVDTVRRRWAEGLLVLAWIVIPVTIISYATSKLFHYAYPFLPPAGLAAGYLVSRFWSAAGARVDRLTGVGHRSARSAGARLRVAAALRRPAVRTSLLALGLVATGVFLWTLFIGPFGFAVAGLRVRNSQLLRPALVAALLLTAGGQPRLAGRLALAVLILLLLPIPAYRATVRRFEEGMLVFRPARDCILRVAARPELMASGPRGLYVDWDGVDYQLGANHEFVYYFRTIAPWIRPRDIPASRLSAFVTDPAQQRPLLMSASRYHALLPGFSGIPGVTLSLPRIALHDDILLVLPGPYSICEAEYIEASARVLR